MFDPPIRYLVGTPKGRLSQLEQELYVLAQSRARIHKERAMHRRKLKWLWARLKEISAMTLKREEPLMKLGAARSKARAVWRLLDIKIAPDSASFSYALNRKKLRLVRRHEGRYLLRTNLCGRDPAQLGRPTDSRDGKILWLDSCSEGLSPRMSVRAGVTQ